MKRTDLERYLSRGDRLGFRKPTDDPDYLGWILLCKRFPHTRYLSRLGPGEDPVFRRKQAEIAKRPYKVVVIELLKSVHESDRYETNEDYRMSELYRFRSLDEVELFVNQFGETLENIRWPIDIDPP